MSALAEAPRVIEGGLHWPYSLEHLPLKDLFVDESYQRPLSTFVKRIADGFDPHLLTPIVVSRRKGRKSAAVVDGQTRMVALRQLGHDSAPCLVFEGTAEEEAMLFARFQSERRSIRPYHRFRAALKAGDPLATAVQDAATAAGYEVADSGSSALPWQINAVRALEDLQKAGRLAEVLELCKGAWPPRHEATAYGKGHPLNNEVLRGLDHFIGHFDYDQGRLLKALQRTNPQELTLRASHLRQGRGHGGKSPGYMAEAILAQYKGRSA